MNKLLAIIALLATVLLSAGCSGFVLKTVTKTVDPYFHGPGIDGTQFEQVGNNVYTFRWNWYRNVVIDTEDGLLLQEATLDLGYCLLVYDV